jgi:hypothetical protein
MKGICFSCTAPPCPKSKNSFERSTAISDATRAQTAAERATIAANLLKGVKERNEDLGRPFDDCFEMGDADEVMRILMERATDDLALRIAVRRNWQTAPRDSMDAITRYLTRATTSAQLQSRASQPSKQGVSVKPTKHHRPRHRRRHFRVVGGGTYLESGLGVRNRTAKGNCDPH